MQLFLMSSIAPLYLNLYQKKIRWVSNSHSSKRFRAVGKTDERHLSKFDKNNSMAQFDRYQNCLEIVENHTNLHEKKSRE